jgi:outer membrane protein assembly factor BamE (lipoprotein component of BamABCDE complex)
MIKKIFIISFFSLLIVGLIIYADTTKIRFDSSTWKQTGQLNQSSYPRLEMAEDLIRDRTLYGKTKQEVIELLGKPSNDGYFKTYDLVYWLGPERGWFSVDSEWLLIQLDDSERVIKYELGRD